MTLNSKSRLHIIDQVTIIDITGALENRARSAYTLEHRHVNQAD
jgi:hypothetical protein